MKRSFAAKMRSQILNLGTRQSCGLSSARNGVASAIACQNGVWARERFNPFRVEVICWREPRVARAPQPWAGLWNAVGVRRCAAERREVRDDSARFTEPGHSAATGLVRRDALLRVPTICGRRRFGFGNARERVPPMIPRGRELASLGMFRCAMLLAVRPRLRWWLR
jgi:hypothetical protein